MTRKLQIIVGAVAASVLGFSAQAQDTPSPVPDRSEHVREQTPRATRLNEAGKASEIIGKTVKNDQSEKLGKVEDLAVDVESGRVVQVILSTGGFIGIGDTLVAVPPGALSCDAEHKTLRLDADKEKLKNAPKFEMSHWAEYSDSDHLGQVYSYYGQAPASGFVQSGDNSPNTVSTRKTDGTWEKDRTVRESGGMIPASRLGQAQRASKLMGVQVRNLQNDKIGNVNNILVDLPAGRVVAIIVSSGGFLGMGDELSAIPPAAFRFTGDRDVLQLDASKEMLTSAPHFKADQWPDFAQPNYADGVYRAYNVEPYFNTNTSMSTAPDNTARNVRDRDSGTLTPLDQGSSQADVATTGQIRKEIIAAKDMSVDARNVKIITMNGHVTLRGPVRTPDEKRLIGEIANRIAGSENVDNQLEVRLTASNGN
jgi:hyperosmotically inducible protein